jgi:OmpA family/WD40-like Beta Propeller Repeat
MLQRLFILLLSLLSAAAMAQDLTVEKLSAPINSGYDEITPVPSRDGNTLYFTRVGSPDYCTYLFLDSVDLYQKLSVPAYRALLGKIYGSIGGVESIAQPIESKYNQDVWVAVGDSARFERVKHPGPPLNNALPNSIVANTPDPNTFYCINQFKRSGDMNRGFSEIRSLDDDEWSFPQPVEIDDFYTITSDVSLTMSFDGQILILSAARFDSKEMDLYVCFRKGERQWSAPQHLGPVVNSDRRETTPFLSEDNTTLFFSSNRNGNQDIYLTKRADSTWTNWNSPVRLVAPINTTSDESQPFFNMSSGYLYFTSKRDGSSDIFRTRLTPPSLTEINLKGRILNRATGDLVDKAEVMYSSPGGTRSQFHSANGEFTLRIPKGVKFELEASKPGFRGQTAEAFFRRDYFFFKDFYIIDLYVDPLEKDALIEMKPILFQKSKPVILEESFAELERLADLLKANPKMHIQVEGHTDNVGKLDDLQRLSEERSAAVRNFLIQKCIDPERIEYVGFGAKYPLNNNESDELRRKNRRVEVRITKMK